LVDWQVITSERDAAAQKSIQEKDSLQGEEKESSGEEPKGW